MVDVYRSTLRKLKFSSRFHWMDCFRWISTGNCLYRNEIDITFWSLGRAVNSEFANFMNFPPSKFPRVDEGEGSYPSWNSQTDETELLRLQEWARCLVLPDFTTIDSPSSTKFKYSINWLKEKFCLSIWRNIISDSTLRFARFCGHWLSIIEKVQIFWSNFSDSLFEPGRLWFLWARVFSAFWRRFPSRALE
jgi:hypothetical protein